MDGVAISPDGRILATGQTVIVPGDKLPVQPSVVLYDIASGGKTDTLVHEKLKGDGRRGEFFMTRFSMIQFGRDGERLFTSGKKVKIWAIRT
jgi:hypothetical protein